MPRYRIPDWQRNFAKQLRSAQTEPERRLWHEVRAKRLDGWQFRRQVPIENYIVDFVCLEARLTVEIDGPLHERRASKVADAERDALLRQSGFRILRFPADIAIASMIQEIRDALAAPPLPTLR
jgi:very-short-patch-repair endonuclease